MRDLIAFVILVLFIAGLSECARAGAWVEFELCKHKTAEKLGPAKMKGFETHGKALVKVSQYDTIVPLKGDKCTYLETEKGGISVVGSYKRTVCLVRGGIDCNLEMRDE